MVRPWQASVSQLASLHSSSLLRCQDSAKTLLRRFRLLAITSMSKLRRRTIRSRQAEMAGGGEAICYDRESVHRCMRGPGVEIDFTLIISREFATDVASKGFALCCFCPMCHKIAHVNCHMLQPRTPGSPVPTVSPLAINSSVTGSQHPPSPHPGRF